VVVGGNEDLVRRPEPERTNSLPESVATEGEEPTARLLQRKRQLAPPAEI